MTFPTSGVLPGAPLDRSLILGDDLADFQAAWAAPGNALQQSWKNGVIAKANQAVSGSVPATWSTAVQDSSVAQAAGLRYALTGSIADLNKAASALANLAIPANNENDFITHPEVLTNYLLAYDFIRGAPLANLAAGTRATIEGRLLSRSQALSYGNGTYSNARAKIGATRALAGLLVGNQAELDQGMNDINGHFEYSTTDDGWFTDSQGHYLNYTLKHLAAFARAYEQGTGVDLHDNLQPYLTMSLGLRLPNGSVPNVSDGLATPVGINLFSQTADAAAASSAIWNVLNFGPGVTLDVTNIQNNDYSDAALFALTDFVDMAPQAPAGSPTFLTTGQSGIAVFRHDWGPTSDYLALSAGIDSPAAFNFPPIVIPAFHSANDTGEILLAARGKYLLVAGGYDRDDLSNSPLGFSPLSADWHNVILVNGNVGPFNEGRTMRPEDFVHSNRLDSAEYGNFKGVSDFSSLQMHYGAATVTRNIAFPGEDYFVVADRMRADAGANTYGFNLIGRGTRTVLANTADRIEVKWENEGAQVIEHLVSSHSMLLATSSIWTHLTFNEFEQTQRITASISATDGLFLSVLETGAAGDPSHLVINKLSSDVNYLGISVADTLSGTVDTILSQHAHNLTTVGDLTSDGVYAYERKLAGALREVMFAEGTELFDLGAPVIATDNRATLSLLFGESTILGTISDDGLTPGTELTFYGMGQILAATLDGAAISFANGVSESSVWLPTGGALVVQLTAVPEASTLVLVGLAGLAGSALARRRNGQ